MPNQDIGTVDNIAIQANRGPKQKESRNSAIKVELSTGGNREIAESTQNLHTQSELFKSYAEANQLQLNHTQQMFWFEFGGNKIGRLFIEGQEAE